MLGAVVVGWGRANTVHLLELDYQPVTRGVLEPVQLLLGVGRGLGIVEDH